jgi:hypothetical protein
MAEKGRSERREEAHTRSTEPPCMSSAVCRSRGGLSGNIADSVSAMATLRAYAHVLAGFGSAREPRAHQPPARK